jgi:hypothetical protein
MVLNLEQSIRRRATKVFPRCRGICGGPRAKWGCCSTGEPPFLLLRGAHKGLYIDTAKRSQAHQFIRMTRLQHEYTKLVTVSAGFIDVSEDPVFTPGAVRSSRLSVQAVIRLWLLNGRLLASAPGKPSSDWPPGELTPHGNHAIPRTPPLISNKM